MNWLVELEEVAAVVLQVEILMILMNHTSNQHILAAGSNGRYCYHQPRTQQWNLGNESWGGFDESLWFQRHPATHILISPKTSFLFLR